MYYKENNVSFFLRKNSLPISKSSDYRTLIALKLPPCLNTPQQHYYLFSIPLLYSCSYRKKAFEQKAFAALSGEENTIATFKNNEDIHQSTASKVFNVLYKM